MVAFKAGSRACLSRVPEFHRRPLGRSWLIGLLIIPLLIAAIGYGALDRPASTNGPTGALPTLAPPNKSGGPILSLASLLITRNGNNITCTGDFPDDSAKAALLKALNGSLGPDVKVIDQIQINPNVDALDFSNAAPIFTASAPITDFSITVGGDTVTLAGTAATADQKTAVDQQASRTWSNLHVVDNITVKVQASGSPTAVPTATPCTDLQSGINAVTGGPIIFGNDGFSLTPADNQILTQVADKLKACPDAHVTINGYTDNSGSEGINIPSSAQRAGTVADFLVAQGVARDHVAVRGLGSINPVATNDTSEGRAQNRRAEIVVS